MMERKDANETDADQKHGEQLSETKESNRLAKSANKIATWSLRISLLAAFWTGAVYWQDKETRRRVNELDRAVVHFSEQVDVLRGRIKQAEPHVHAKSESLTPLGGSKLSPSSKVKKGQAENDQIPLPAKPTIPAPAPPH
jgi:hypothetical protein